jgi:predicted transcriptional regulator
MLASENKTVVREYRESKGLSIKEVSKGAKIPIGTLYMMLKSGEGVSKPIKPKNG